MDIKIGSLAILFVLCCSCSSNDSTTDVPDYFHDGLADGVNYGIASQYINDEGIENNQYVLSVEDFETGEVTISTEEDRYKSNVNVVTIPVLDGQYAGEHLWPEGLQGPTCRYVIPEKAHEGDRLAYFVRMYFWYDSSFHPGEGMEPVGVKGFGIYNEFDDSEPCNGENWYCVSCQFVGWGPSSKDEANDGYLWFGHMYSYCPDAAQARSALGEINLTDSEDTPSYRFSIYSDPYYYLKFNKWYCYEVGLYLNTPGKNDGEARFWINGVLQSRAVNMRFRDIENLKPEYVQLNLHRTTENFPQTMKRYVDNIVISTRYIGPMTISN